MLKCIAYISTATTHFDTQMLADLLSSCIAHNEKQGITGVMWYHNYSFLQFIEGEASAVEALFSAIEQDARHKNVAKLFDQSIAQRAFPNFAMSLTNWADLDGHQQAIFQDLNMLDFRADADTNALSKAINTFLLAFKSKRS